MNRKEHNMVFEQSPTQAISAQMGSLDIGKAELSNRLKWGGVRFLSGFIHA